MVFYNFCYHFWDQHLFWTETSIINKDVFVFWKFPLFSTLLLPPLLYRLINNIVFCPPYNFCSQNIVHLCGIHILMIQENAFARVEPQRPYVGSRVTLKSPQNIHQARYICQRCSDSSFFESDSSPDPRVRNPDPDPNPVCNTTMKSLKNLVNILV